MKQCPRCKSEEIRNGDNYCKICGLELRKITAQEIPVQEQCINSIREVLPGVFVNLDNEGICREYYTK